MVELYKMYRFSSNIYTIPVWFSEDGYYLYIIEVSKSRPVASLERVIVRSPYDKGNVNLYGAGFDRLTSKQEQAIFHALFR